VDRVFTLRGAGTIVTGTLWAGSVGAGAELLLEPRGRIVRVRNVQVHDRDVERAEAGQRVALNLSGVAVDELSRGDALVAPDSFAKSYRIDVSLEPLDAIPAAVTLHHGTAQIPARVVRADERHAQLRLAAPIVSARGDRFVLRAETTVGGGVVLDPSPPRRVDAGRLANVESGDAAAFVHEPVQRRELELRGLDPSRLQAADGWVFSAAWLEDLEHELVDRIAAADPLDPGVTPPSAPWAEAVVPLLGLERRGAKLYAPQATAALAGREEQADLLLASLVGYEPVAVDDDALARHLESEGRLVRVGKGFALGREAYDRALELLIDTCTRERSITLARFRDLLGTSRRPAQLLLERFDADGLTRRVGDTRVLRRRASS
jgi:selenocysteine-specific elongation factor